MQTGYVIGYDPGGNNTHGLALLELVEGRAARIRFDTASTVEQVIATIAELTPVLAIGIDTLTCWSSGSSGWRPADRFLRARYPEVQSSVVSPNGLYGSMGLSGMAVLFAARASQPGVPITETHPKVLHWHLSRRKHAFATEHRRMTEELATLLCTPIECANEHEWDAGISTFAALRGIRGEWKTDLHSLPTNSGERLVSPAGPTNYFWPA